MDAIDLLTRQHRELEASLKAVLDASSDADRQAGLARAGDHLAVHLASEEEVFYPAVRARKTEGILLESLEEHLSLKRLLADLLELAPSAQTFEPKVKVLGEQAEHHHKEEEENLFPKVATLLDDGERSALGEQMAALQQRLSRAGDPRDDVAAQTGEAAPLV
jgi:hemerythrin superfamily protein